MPRELRRADHAGGAPEPGQPLAEPPRTGRRTAAQSSRRRRRVLGTAAVTARRAVAARRSASASSACSGAGSGARTCFLELGLDKLVTVGKARRKLDADAVLRGDVGATNEAVRALVEAEAAPTFEPLNMVKDLRINDLDFAESAAELANLLKRRDGLVSRPCAQLATQYALTRERTLLREQVDRLRHMLSNESLGLFPDYQKRLQVLHKLGHISDDGAVALKGRVASEVNSVDELVATEIVFDPLLSELEPAEIAAVLSALVVQDRTVDSQHLSLTPHLLEACKRIEQLVHALAHVQRAAGLELDTDAYVLERCKFGLVEVVHEWTSGQPFSEVMQLTSASEGAVVRTTARVRERAASCAAPRGSSATRRSTAGQGARSSCCATASPSSRPPPQQTWQLGFRVRARGHRAHSMAGMRHEHPAVRAPRAGPPRSSTSAFEWPCSSTPVEARGVRGLAAAHHENH